MGGSLPNASSHGAKFESNLEDFHATLDQIEVTLRCAISCQQQAQASNRYMQIPPIPARLESTSNNPDEFLTYPQYISVAKKQIAYANDIKVSLTTPTVRLGADSQKNHDKS